MHFERDTYGMVACGVSRAIHPLRRLLSQLVQLLEGWRRESATKCLMQQDVEMRTLNVDRVIILPLSTEPPPVRHLGRLVEIRQNYSKRLIVRVPG